MLSWTLVKYLSELGGLIVILPILFLIFASESAKQLTAPKKINHSDPFDKDLLENKENGF